MKSSRNLDFIYLAVLPVAAAVLFFLVYVEGTSPNVPLPNFTNGWTAALERLRNFASENESVALAGTVAIAVGVVGVTWFAMIVLDARKGIRILVRWLFRRRQSLVSGILKPEDQPSWTFTMGTSNEPVQRYRAKKNRWSRDRSR